MTDEATRLALEMMLEAFDAPSCETATANRAITAARKALRAIPQGPVAWQRRRTDRHGKWQDWVECSADPQDQQRYRNAGYEIRPLYAAAEAI